MNDYLRLHPPRPHVYCCLSGNSDMIHEVFHILIGQGVPREHILTEVFF